MSDLVVVEAGDPDEVIDQAKAIEIGLSLEKHYPDHPWTVAFQGKVIVVKHMAISMVYTQTTGKSGIGFVLKYADSYSASELAHNAMIAGGQLLEAFGLPRGRWNGEMPVCPHFDKRELH